MPGDIMDTYSMPSTSCPCGPDDYYCQLPGYGCSVINILGKASHITSKNQPGYWNDLDMLEVGNGDMSYDEYKTHFSMWAAIKSPLIMGNKLDKLSPEDYGILTNPAVLAISQDPMGSAIQRRYVRQVAEKDEWGFGEVQIWSGALSGGDQVVAFLNVANSTQMISASLLQIFGGLKSNENAQSNWELYDLWGAQTVMNQTVAAGVLNGTMELGNSTLGYYNATETSWADGLAANDTRLLGTRVSSVGVGGSIETEVPRHGITLWRLRNMGGSGMKKDEL